MLRYLIQVIQNLLSTGILIALLGAAVSRSERPRSRAWFVRGALAGAAAALVLTILRRATNLVNREYVNTLTLFAAIVSGAIYLALLWKKRPGPRQEGFLDRAGAVLAASLLFYALPTILLYVPGFVLPGESIFSTDFLFKLIGFSAGLTVAVLASAALYAIARASGPFLAALILTAALAVNMVNQVSAIVQFLLGRRIISVSRHIFSLIVFIINYNTLFLYTLMALALVLPLAAFAGSFSSSAAYANPAEHRKIRAALRRSRRLSCTVVLGFALSVVSLTVVKAYNERGVELSPAEPMTITGAEITIPIERIEDGHLHRFAFSASDGTEVRFIVIKKNEIAYGVGLDACDICGATGYYERKNQVICRLCDVVMNISTIGFRGGCNPVPLAYSLRSGNMVILTENLENEKGRFK
ncbi:MAG: DUF2318 domain-containing protein [Spirochaetaceae bacterium]|jgi:uncharacterized membrane protein|nr:DUF2318 domain-containing protein [Spirochaetaceae bacterium]